MSRPLRIEYEGAIYHVMSRGERKDDIFWDDNDRRYFINRLEETVTKYRLNVHCFCMMNNHYHLLLETPLGNLCQSMHYLNAGYSNYFRIRHTIVGSVFQGRYKSILVQDDSYFFTLTSYIHLNPLRSNIVDDLHDYKWSSYLDYAQHEKTYPWLYKDILLSKIGFSNYHKTLMNWNTRNKKIPKENIYGIHGILGAEKFIMEQKTRIRTSPAKLNMEEMPDGKAITALRVFELEAIISKIFHINKEKIYEHNRKNIYKQVMMYGLKKYSAMDLNEIGRLMGIKPQSVSISVTRLLSKCSKDRVLSNLVKKVDKNIKSLS